MVSLFILRLSFLNSLMERTGRPSFRTMALVYRFGGPKVGIKAEMLPPTGDRDLNSSQRSTRESCLFFSITSFSEVSFD